MIARGTAVAETEAAFGEEAGDHVAEGEDDDTDEGTDDHPCQAGRDSDRARLVDDEHAEEHAERAEYGLGDERRSPRLRRT